MINHTDAYTRTHAHDRCRRLDALSPILALPHTVNHSLKSVIEFPPGAKVIEELMRDDKRAKKSAIKGAHTMRKEGPVKQLVGIHGDGRKLTVKV